MAIVATLNLPPDSEGRPRAPRRVLRLAAQGALSSGRAAQVTVHNISATGLLLKCETGLSAGERIDVELPQAGLTAMEVVWESGTFFGCRFDAPISQGALSAAQLQGAIAPDEEAGAPAHPVSQEGFGARLQRLRKSRGLSLAQLAEQLGVSKPTVWAWEQGRSRPVDSRLAALTEALGVGPSELLQVPANSELATALARSRELVAMALGVTPDKVRIAVDF